MTTFSQRDVTCGVCGLRQSVHEIMSTSTFGPSDLDGRPAEMRRSTMPAWRQECSQCGFVSENLTNIARQVPHIVQSQEYRDERANPARPALANKFACSAMIYERIGGFERAAWDRLAAAWACDDAMQPAQALAQRLAAIRLFDLARMTDPDKQIEQLATVVDLTRRVGRFEHATELARRGQSLAAASPHPQSRDLYGAFAFQIELCGRGDLAAHTYGEAPPLEAPAEPPPPPALANALTWADVANASSLAPHIVIEGVPWQLVDEIEMLDSDSERTHDLQITDSTDTYRARQKLKYPDGTVVEDIGRAHVDCATTYTIWNLRRGMPLAIVRRSDYVYGDYELEMRIDGVLAGAAAVVGSDRVSRWRNWYFIVPGELVTADHVAVEQRVRTCGRDVNMFHYWFYQLA